MDNLATRIRRLAVPIIIGLFALIFGAFGFLYIQQWQEHGRLESAIERSQGQLAESQPISEEFQNEYDEIIDTIPVVLNDAQETEFNNEVKQLVREMTDTRMVGGVRLFPSVDVDDTATFSIRSAGSGTIKIGSSAYWEYNFEVVLVDITYEEVTGFIEALEDIEGLETLNVFDVQIEEDELGFDLTSKFKVIISKTGD